MPWLPRYRFHPTSTIRQAESSLPLSGFDEFSSNSIAAFGRGAELVERSASKRLELEAEIEQLRDRLSRQSGTSLDVFQLARQEAETSMVPMPTMIRQLGILARGANLLHQGES